MIDPKSLDLSVLPWMPLSAKTGLIDQPGIYFAIDSLDVVQYIGRSQGVRGRWQGHHRFGELSQMGGVRICYLAVEDKSLLPSVEQALIFWFQPPLNRETSGTSSRKCDSSTEGASIKWELAALMTKRGVDYKKLADSTGLHPVTVSKLKNTRLMPRRLDSETLAKLCKALDCQPGDLLLYSPDD